MRRGKWDFFGKICVSVLVQLRKLSFCDSNPKMFLIFNLIYQRHRGAGVPGQVRTFSPDLCGSPLGAPASSHVRVNARSVGDSKLAVGVNVSVGGAAPCNPAEDKIRDGWKKQSNSSMMC